VIVSAIIFSKLTVEKLIIMTLTRAWIYFWCWQYGSADSTSSSTWADPADRNQIRSWDSCWNTGTARQRRLSRNTQTMAAVRRYPVRSLGEYRYYKLLYVSAVHLL